MQAMTTLRIGIDDTDSECGMCTTWLAYRIVSGLRNRGDEVSEYPRLIRLNPNVPWKTRGNGAVGITIRTRDPKGAKRHVASMVSRHADIANGANPGLVFLEAESVPGELREFAREALWRVIPMSHANLAAARAGLECHTIGNGRGLVGAISAVGYEFGDSTMELLAYRSRAHIGKPRKIESESVRKMHERTFPSTFNSYDAKSGRVLIAPHGADPVLYGIRGEDAKTLVAASRTIRGEAPAGHMIFISNQGTGDHLQNMLDPNALHAHESGIIDGVVGAAPHIIGGGHVRIKVVSRGTSVDCYVYHPTGMGGLARALVRGDRICVGGGTKRGRTGRGISLNVETIMITSLVDVVRVVNPMCGRCSKRMKSKGVGQGFKCARCGQTAKAKERISVRRNASVGLHVAQASAQRHLARPAHRTACHGPRAIRPWPTSWVR